MVNGFALRRVVALLMVVFCMAAPGAALADALAASFEQPAPFGIVRSEGGGDIDVFEAPLSGERAGVLRDGQLCAVASMEALGGSVWYGISYIDEAGEEIFGYVAADGFSQLTIAGLVAAMADPETAARIQQFSALAASAAFVAPYGGDATALAAAEAHPSETEAPAQPQ